jgi:hypothetical protein
MKQCNVGGYDMQGNEDRLKTCPFYKPEEDRNDQIAICEHCHIMDAVVYCELK